MYISLCPCILCLDVDLKELDHGWTDVLTVITCEEQISQCNSKALYPSFYSFPCVAQCQSKVDILNLNTFLTASTSCTVWTMQIGVRLGFPICACSHLPQNVLELLWISILWFKWNFLCSLSGPTSPPNHVVFLVSVLRSTPNHVLLNERFLDCFCVGIWHVYLKRAPLKHQGELLETHTWTRDV